MRLKRSISLLSFLLVMCGSAVAQGTTDEQLAAYYYRSGEYDKAALYYQRLYEARPSDEYYGYYFKCLLAQEDFKTAEKVAKGQAKQFPKAYQYQVDIGKVYKRQEENSKAQKHFEKLIKGFESTTVSQYITLGNAFNEISEPDFALDIYKKGRKQFGKDYPFNFQIAEILGQKGDVEGMINEYLDVLEISPGYLQSVQNTLNRVIGFEDENKYSIALQTELMKRVQRDADNKIYGEMLVWMLVKQGKFDLAFSQVRALDKRYKEDGDRMMELGILAVSNYEYNVAIKAFEYVKSKGRNNYHYVDATTELLRTLKLQITSNTFTQAQIEKLLEQYVSTLEILGRNQHTVELIRDQASIMAYYQSAFDSRAADTAAVLLEQALMIPGIDPQERARTKIALGDVYVILGNIWEASLLFGQVEKAFKYDELGFSAKFKNARVFYFSGDFGWAQSQLNVLKGSTSKLIANDALELSIFITENLGIDSNVTALRWFSKAELMLAQHQYDSARFMLSTLRDTFPSHDLADDIYFQEYKIAYQLQEYAQAESMLQKVIDGYSYGLLADNAMMKLAELYEGPLNQPTKAMDLYQRLMTDYSGSLFVVEARKRFRRLRGDVLN